MAEKNTSSSPIKCIALDLDNTLWPGVLLEAQDSEGEVAWPACFSELHAALLRLYSQGVLLVSVSRNDEAPVLAAWPPQHLCRLRPDEHFVAHRFGWGPKSERLGAFMAAVGLAPEAVVFVDDRAAERQEVQTALPTLGSILGADLSVAARVLNEEADARVRRSNGAAVSADAASRTVKTRAVLARAAAAEAFAAAVQEGEDEGRQPASKSSSTQSTSADGSSAGSQPSQSKKQKSGESRPTKSGGGASTNLPGRSKGADKRRRKAAKLAGAAERVPGTGGGYATVGGYPESFLRTLDLKLFLRRCGVARTTTTTTTTAAAAAAAATAGGGGDVGGGARSKRQPGSPAAAIAAQHDSGRGGGDGDGISVRDDHGEDRDDSERLLARAAELAARTTQFNTVEPRPEEEVRLELEALLGRGGQVWLLSATDRFGDHGVVGVIGLEERPVETTATATATATAAAAAAAAAGGLPPSSDDSSGCSTSSATTAATRVILVSVSCRVLALEPAPVFLAEVLRRSGLAGPVDARLAITARNMPCRSLFGAAGFRQRPQQASERRVGTDKDGEEKEEKEDSGGGGEQWWVLDSLQSLPVPDPKIYTVVVGV